nr:SURF1 family protein [Breoghania corrubedonensis]
MVSVFILIGIVAGSALGVWQVQRRAWKLDLIDRVETRVHQPAKPAPGPDTWPTISRDGDEYRHVRVTGHFLNDKETLVRAATDLGSGYWVLTPLESARGFTVLVNRGFVPPERKDPATRAQGLLDATASVEGLLRISEPKGGFLRSNDPAGGRWYSRDVTAIAKARGLKNVAPYFIDAGAAPNPGGYPVGGLTKVSFYNHHLSYAITWFTLSLMSLAAGLYLVREERRARRRRNAFRPGGTT